MKYSFIIPVYNAEKYLRNCVESILSQTYTDLEIILVDDASPDHSYELGCKLHQEDARVVIYQKENGGTSDTRNYGMKKATGDYILFMDNDDYWNDKEALEKINNQLNESHADVLMFNYVSYWEKEDYFRGNEAHCSRGEIVNKKPEEALSALLEKGLLFPMVWVKVIKREIIEQNNMYFPVHMRNEDTEWSGRLLIYAKSYDWLDQSLYVYRKGMENAQTTQRVSYQSWRDLKIVCERIIRETEESVKNQEQKESIYAYMAYSYAVWMGQAFFFNKKERSQDMKDMKKYLFLFDYDLDPYVKLVRKFVKIFGYYGSAICMNMYFRIRGILRLHRWTKKY